MSRNTLVVALVIAALWMYSHPAKPPQPDRPVVNLLARAARLLLWTMWLAEPPSAHVEYHAAGEQLSHKEGW